MRNEDSRCRYVFLLGLDRMGRGMRAGWSIKFVEHDLPLNQQVMADWDEKAEHAPLVRSAKVQ
jgi:hypothetical protein